MSAFEDKIKQVTESLSNLGLTNMLEGAIIEELKKEFRAAGEAATIKPSKTKTVYNTFFTHNKTTGARTQTIDNWDGLLDQFRADTNIRKVNTLLLDKDMNLITKNNIEAMIHQLIENISPKTASDVAKKVYSGIENEVVKANKYEIIFNNGKYNLQNKTFTCGDFPSINKIPWDYNPTATSKLGREILDRYVGDNEGFDIQVFEALGVLAAQDKGFNFKKTFFFDGPSDYAKSFLTEELLQPALGKHNFANIDVATLDDQELAAFINKTAVFDDDMDRGSWETRVISRFKKITGSNTLKAKVLYQDRFDFTNMATAWINCNGLPEMKDTGSGGAIETRMHIIKATVNIKKKYNDPKVYDNVAKHRKEISEWLLKEAMEALSAAIDRGHLTDTEASRTAMVENLEYKDTVFAWMKVYNWGTLNGNVEVAKLYNIYKESFQENQVNYGKGNAVYPKTFAKSIRDYATQFRLVVEKSHGTIKVRQAIAGEEL